MSATLTAVPVRHDLEHLVTALEVHPAWQIVLLKINDKAPVAGPDGSWIVTRDRDRVQAHLRGGGNIGLKAGAIEDLVIFDVDDALAYSDLWEQLGPLADATVLTASGKLHTYTRWAPGVPAKLVTLDGAVVGEPRRGESERGQMTSNKQMAVCPPSRIDGRVYRFTEDADLTQPLPEIPDAWVTYFARFTPKPAPPPRPVDPVALGDRYAAALAMPGARRRAGGAEIKFQCPACAAGGWDRPRDNARLFRDGRWGCAVHPKGTPESLTHWRAIGIALGVLRPDGRYGNSHHGWAR